MAKFQKGLPRPAGAGRKKGTPNHTTQNTREAIANLLDNNAGRLQKWLDEIYRAHGALEAFKCFTGLIEYHVPKLARAEVINTPKPIMAPTNLPTMEEAEAAYKEFMGQ